MRHARKTVVLGRTLGPRRSLLKNLAEQLIVREKIKTTEAKAKAIRPIVEKLITKGKKGDLHSYRQLLAYLPTENAAKKIKEVLAPRYQSKQGGYLRIIKAGHRPGDGSHVVQIEFV